jgi:dienelactone hydrolase
MPSILVLAFLAAAGTVETGTVQATFTNRKLPRDAAHLTPPSTAFSWRREEFFRDSGVTGYRLTFPSPVTTKHECNNTVWCEYFVPQGSGKFPAVVVLHFLNDPDFMTTRFVSERFARAGIAALMLKLPYYGERRPNENVEELFSDLNLWDATFTQGVQDIRRAIAWLVARPEVDPERTGLVGISLGAMVGSLVTAVEPRVKRAVLIVGGGQINEIMWTAPEAGDLRKALRERGIDREKTGKILEPVEPVRFAAPLPEGTLLMINGKKDTTIPPSCTEALAAGFKTAEVVWYDTTHTGLSAHLTEVLERVIAFVTRPVGAACAPATAKKGEK